MKDYDTGEELDEDPKDFRGFALSLPHVWGEIPPSHPMCRCSMHPIDPNRMYLGMVLDIGRN